MAKSLSNNLLNGSKLKSAVRSQKKDNEKKRFNTLSGIQRKDHSVDHYISDHSTQIRASLSNLRQKSNQKIEDWQRELDEIKGSCYIAWNRKYEIKQLIKNELIWLKQLS